MKDFSNKSHKKATPEDRNRLLDLYNSAPYPETLADKMPQGAPLLAHWINAAVAPNGLGLHPEANMLIAGCGSGAEAFLMARQFPNATIVGIDFSEQSIARAKILAATENLNNITFEVADLTTAEWSKKYAPFDFISCHGVADFVLDVDALMNTLASCLASNGVICMTVNSPFHPAGRLREAFATLGISPADFADSPKQRTLLQMMVGLMGNHVGIEGLAMAPKAYLDVDIFAPIAHHDSLETWNNRAKEAGLHFCGSMDAPVGLTQLSDEQLPLLYGLDKPTLSIWMARLSQGPGMRMLFSKPVPKEPNFSQANSIATWCPKLTAAVGILPSLEGDAHQPRPMTLRFAVLPDFVIHTTAYDLEVLRNCDGQHSIEAIKAMIPVPGNSETLLACLFRAYHFGILMG